MSQKFFTSTLESKFIKYLLSYTPLPIIPTISSDDTMIAGCYYIYKQHIIKCLQTGRFLGDKANSFIDDHLYINDWLYCTDDDNVLAHYNEDTKKYDIFLVDEGKGNGEPGVGGLTVTDDIIRVYYRPVATYQLVDDFRFGNYIPNLTQQFVSNVSYYDPATHRFLGEYLRCIRDIYGVDLMGMYNCFDYDMTTNFSLSEEKGVVETEALKSKVLLVPIKFNKTYTIAMDCDFPVLVKSVLYDDVLLKDSEGKTFTSKIQESVIKFNGLRFNSPVTYSVTNNFEIELIKDELKPGETEEEKLKELRQYKYELDKELQDKEKYLYLAIQVPKTNNSSIVVVEGDYSTVAMNYTCSAEGISSLSDKQIANVFRSNISLLKSNDNRQHPYADKLISYLLQFAIDGRELIDENVERIENEFGYQPPIKDFVKGIWDNDLRYSLYNRYMQINNVEYIEKYDILGFVDRDIERAVNQRLMTYESKE